ncbi:hypothetical protein Tco_0482257 [Tanacetum coccineum]
MGDANHIRTLGDYSKPSHEGYRNTIKLSVRNNVDSNQHLKDFLKLVDSLDLDYENKEKARNHFASRCPEYIRSRLIELENQVQRLIEAHLALTQPTQVNKITTSCEICSGPRDAQYCMEDPEQAFVEYASSRTHKMGSRPFTMNQGPRSFNEAVNAWKENLNFNSAHAQTFTNLQNDSLFTYSSNYKTKLKKALIDFGAHQEKRLSSLRTQIEQQQDDMISKINLL